MKASRLMDGNCLMNTVDTEVQLERVWGQYNKLFQEGTSEDVMEACSTVSLDMVSGYYNPEETICQEMDENELFDEELHMEYIRKGWCM